jgi:hypothetical protein
MAGGRVALGVLALEQSLGPAVAALLSQIPANRRTTMVKDDRAGRKRDSSAGVEQPPAQIDVIARHAKAGVEATEAQKIIPANGHVAAGDVLGLTV